jgi:hypothetical protein
MQHFFRLCMICFLLILYSPSQGLAVSRSNNHYASNITPIQKSLKPGKPLKVKVVLYKLVQRLLANKNSKSGIAIAFGILSALLLSFVLFALAYGGASGVIVVLIGAVGIALIVLGLKKIAKAQKRKQQSS